MMTEEKVKELTKDIQRRIKSTNRWLSSNKSIGNPEGEAFRQIEIYELALSALTQPASPDGSELAEVIEGMEVSVDVSTGDHDASNRYFGTVTEVVEHETGKNGFILLVQDAEPNFTQPASPALKLPLTIEPEDVPGLIDPTANPDEYACCVGKDVWDACLREVAKLNALHTAPIEPIRATGGAEWVKCSERMPESKPGMWSKEVAAVSELGDVFKLSAMGDYWQRSKSFIESGAKEITHWMTLPTAPEDT